LKFLLILVQTIYAISLDAGLNHFLNFNQIKPGPYAGAEFDYGLSDYTSLYVQAAFSYLKVKNENINELYQFIGRTGIESSEQLFKYASIGFGVSLAGIRGTPKSGRYIFSSSESEFGWNARLKLNLFRIEKFTFGTKFHYDNIWTQPKNTSLFQGGVFVNFSLG